MQRFPNKYSDYYVSIDFLKNNFGMWDVEMGFRIWDERWGINIGSSRLPLYLKTLRTFVLLLLQVCESFW